MAVKMGTQPVQTHSYGYDTVDRLTAVTKPAVNQAYVYDSVGNRTSKTDNAVATSYTANNLNQYTQVNAATFTYDARGNLTSDGVLAMTYDTDNRLTQIMKGADAINNTYDVTNRLITQTVNGTLTRFVYDGWNVIAEVGNSGNIKKKYIHGPRVDEILSQKKGNQTLYLTRDGLGSTRELTKENGNVQQRFDYDAFGAVTVMDKNGAVIPDAPKVNYLFTGRELQPETGLYNYRNRFYHPGVGRFLQTDPVELLGGINIYSYVGNNSINALDPLGLVRWGQFFKGVGAFAGGAAAAYGAPATGPFLPLVAVSAAIAMSYGLGNMVAAFAGDECQAKQMENSPGDLGGAVGRAWGGQQGQAVGSSIESSANFYSSTMKKDLLGMTHSGLSAADSGLIKNAPISSGVRDSTMFHITATQGTNGTVSVTVDYPNK